MKKLLTVILVIILLGAAIGGFLIYRHTSTTIGRDAAIEAALADALNNGQIAGAAADTLSTEPPPADNPLLTAKNCIITPHFAWATAEAKSRLVDVLVNNIKAFAEGAPINVVN